MCSIFLKSYLECLLFSYKNLQYFIHLDSFQQEGNILMLLGEVYAKWCEKKSLEDKWYKYRLTVKGVKKYSANSTLQFKLNSHSLDSIN